MLTAPRSSGRHQAPDRHPPAQMDGTSTAASTAAARPDSRSESPTSRIASATSQTRPRVRGREHAERRVAIAAGERALDVALGGQLDRARRRARRPRRPRSRASAGPASRKTGRAAASTARSAKRIAVASRLPGSRSDPSIARVDKEEPHHQPRKQPHETERDGEAEQRSEPEADRGTGEHRADQREARRSPRRPWSGDAGSSGCREGRPGNCGRYGHEKGRRAAVAPAISRRSGGPATISETQHLGTSRKTVADR